MIAEIATLSIDGEAQDELVADIEGIDVREDADGPLLFSIRVALDVDSDGSWTMIDDERFRVWRRLAVRAGYDSPGETIADGYVTHVDTVLSEDGGAYLELSGSDATALMDVDEHQLAWPNKTDSDIAEAIFKEHGLKPDVETTNARHEEKVSTILQMETDIRFLRRLAARNGFECRVDGRTGVFRTPKLSEPPQKALAIASGEATNLVELQLQVDGTPVTQPEVRRVDPVSKQVEKRTLTTSPRRALGKTPLTTLRSGGTALVRHHAAASIPELEALTRAAYEGANGFVTLSGEIDSRAYRSVLRAGRLVIVAGAGATHSGLYYVSRVHHSFTVDGYVQRFEAYRNGIGSTGEDRVATLAEVI